MVCSPLISSSSTVGPNCARHLSTPPAALHGLLTVYLDMARSSRRRARPDRLQNIPRHCERRLVSPYCGLARLGVLGISVVSLLLPFDSDVR